MNTAFAARSTSFIPAPNTGRQPLIDISAHITAVNRLRATIATLNEEGPQRQIDSGDPAVACLLRREQQGPSWVLSLFNTDLHQPHQAHLAGLDGDVQLAREVTPGSAGQTLATSDAIWLTAGEARIFVNA